MKIRLLPVFLLIQTIPQLSFGNSCPWVATVDRSTEQIIQDITKKSGKTPTVSCGAGADFKVCHSCTEKLTAEQWKRIRPMLAQPSYRRWHERLHSSAELDALMKAKDGTPYKDIQGESFLFAHREMIRTAQANLAALGLPCLAPWAKLPDQADDPMWPTFNIQKYQKVKALCEIPKNAEALLRIAAFNNEMSSEKQKISEQINSEKERISNDIKDLQKRFTQREEVAKKHQALLVEAKNVLMNKYRLSEEQISELRSCATFEKIAEENKSHRSLVSETTQESSTKNLKTRTLGNTGNTISVLWHGTLHVVYNTIQPESCTLEDVAPECDNMDSNFSSHVNMNFYKIHSYIDGFVDKWLKENNYTTVQKNCRGKAGCYQWKGTFLGDIPDFVDGSGCTLESSNNSLSGSARKRHISDTAE